MAQGTQLYGNGDAESGTVIQLYVGAARLKDLDLVDRIGPIIFDQQWFMVYYVLAKHKLMHLWVTTVEMLNVCKVEVIKGQAPDSNMDISGKMYETNDEIENFSATFRCPDIQPAEVNELRTTQNKILPFALYGELKNVLVNDISKFLDATLTKLNDYLQKNGRKFIFKDQVTFADCMLLPRLHHVRVAAKAYKNYEIPAHLTHVWRYLQHAYQDEAFRLTCPSDQEIIFHYLDHVDPETKQKMHRACTTKATTYSFEIPDYIEEVHGATNGGGEKDNETGE